MDKGGSSKKPKAKARPYELYRFENLFAWVVGVVSEFECLISARNPKDYGFTGKHVFPIRLDKTPHRMVERWDQVQTSNFRSPDRSLGKLGQTTIGPRFCESGASYNGGIFIAQPFLERLRKLGYDIPPMTEYFNGAYDYEFKSVIRVPHDPTKRRLFYHGFHGTWRNGTGYILQRGRSNVDTKEVFTVGPADWLEDPEGRAIVLKDTEYTKVKPTKTGTQKGAIYILDEFAEGPTAFLASYRTTLPKTRGGGSSGSDPKRPPAFFQDQSLEGRLPAFEAKDTRLKWAQKSLAKGRLSITSTSIDAVTRDLCSRLKRPIQIQNIVDLNELLKQLAKDPGAGADSDVILDLIGHSTGVDYHLQLADLLFDESGTANTFFTANATTFRTLKIKTIRLLGCWTAGGPPKRLEDFMTTVNAGYPGDNDKIEIQASRALVAPDNFDGDGFETLENFRIARAGGAAPPLPTPNMFLED